MGVIQKDAIRTTMISYLGLILGYLNKGVLFVFILSTEQIGLINLILSLSLLFAQFSNLGVINSTWKFLPFFHHSGKQLYNFLRLSFGIVTIGLILTTVLFFLSENLIVNYYQEKSSAFVDNYYWIIPIGMANVYFLLFENYLKGLYKHIVAVFAYEILLRLFVMVLLIMLWKKIIDFNSFFILHAFIYFIPTLVLFVYLIKLGEITFTRSVRRIPKRIQNIIIKYGAFSYLNSVGAMLVTTIDATMIAAMVGLSGAGIYTTVMYLTSALQVPYRAMFRVSIPLIGKYWKEKNMDAMNDLYRQFSSVNLVIGSGMFLLVWVNVDELFSLLPTSFNEGIYVFFFLMLGKLTDMYMGVNSMILATSKKYRIDILFAFIMICIVSGLNYLFIPDLGIVGAAISTMIALIVYNSLRTFYLWKKFGLNPFKLQQLIVLIFFSITLTINHYNPINVDGVIINIVMGVFITIIGFVIPVIVLKLEPKFNEILKNIVQRFR